jgi:hypothetical protein
VLGGAALAGWATQRADYLMAGLGLGLALVGAALPFIEGRARRARTGAACPKCGGRPDTAILSTDFCLLCGWKAAARRTP